MTQTTSNITGASQKPRSGGAPKQLIVFLHGVGADGDDLISLSSEMNDALPDAQFVSPNAPFPCDMAPFGYQWFSLQSRSHDAMLSGVQQVAPILNQYLDEQLMLHNLTDDKMAIVGFSQGTMTALYTMPRRAKACAAVVGFSGAMIGGNMLAEEKLSAPPICLIHGQRDDVVPFEAMRAASDALREAGIDCETHARPNLAHGIDPEGLELAIAYLKKHLA